MTYHIECLPVACSAEQWAIKSSNAFSLVNRSYIFRFDLDFELLILRLGSDTDLTSCSASFRSSTSICANVSAWVSSAACRDEYALRILPKVANGHRVCRKLIIKVNTLWQNEATLHVIKTALITHSFSWMLGSSECSQIKKYTVFLNIGMITRIRIYVLCSGGGHR